MLREREALIQDLFERVIVGDSLPPEPTPIVYQKEQTQDEKPPQVHIKREPQQPKPPSISKSNPHPSTHEQAADIKRREERARAKEFFNKFLEKANDAQIEIFKAVMETPTVKTIQALLNIPFIPKMIEEEKKKDKEKWNNTTAREFCREYTKYNQKLFEECLKDLYKKKQNQSIGPTQ